LKQEGLVMESSLETINGVAVKYFEGKTALEHKAILI
jgi:hypothetical protein